MSLQIEFSISKRKLKITDLSDRANPVHIEMDAISGNNHDVRSVVTGEWLIVENPRGTRNYFALFYVDKNINDQFLDEGTWRDGIRMGHNRTGLNHGCIMTHPGNLQFDAFEKSKEKWAFIQNLIRTKGPKRLHRYKNNENPKFSDPKVYAMTSYGTLKVVK